MIIALYVLATVLASGVLLAVRIVIYHYRAERKDYERSPSLQISRQPERTGIAALREVAFTAPGETQMAGWYAPSRNRAAILLIHGTGADRSSLLTETRMLAEAGYGVLAMDLPGQGMSEGQTQWGAAERQAIRAAIDWLGAQAEIDSERIGGFGLSMGAYVLTQAAVLDTRLRAVILAGCPTDVVEQNWVASSKWGPLSQWPTYLALRLSGQSLDMLPKNIIADIAPRAVFILGGTLDRAVPEYMGRQLFAAAHEPKELWMIPGAGHGDYGQIAPQAYANRLADFFRRTLLNERADPPS